VAHRIIAHTLPAFYPTRRCSASAAMSEKRHEGRFPPRVPSLEAFGRPPSARVDRSRRAGLRSPSQEEPFLAPRLSGREESTPALRQRVGEKSATLSASEGKWPLGSRTRRARLMTTRRGQAPPSPLQISAPFCPLLCGAIDRSQPLPGRTRSSPPQHCNGASPRSQSLKQQHNFRHRFANPIRAGRPTPASLPVHHIEIARALVAKGRFGPVPSN
jgi:hypothetical protein